MPHMASSNEMAESYSGLHFQQLTAQVSIPPGNADTDVEAFENVEPVEPQGLDNDEIAELVDIEVHSQLEISGDATDDNQTEYGNADTEIAIEVNAGNQDNTLPNLTTDGDDFSVVEDDGGAALTFLFEDDEPGRLYAGRYTATPAFASAADGNGGTGQVAVSDRYHKNYRDDFGRGPAVDANDDLGVFIEIGNDNVTSSIVSSIFVQMVWDIHTVEGQRGQFALP